MKQKYLFGILLMAGIINMLISCSKESVLYGDPSETFIEEHSGFEGRLYKGPVVQVGEGSACSWFFTNVDGSSMELGIEFTPLAMQGLSTMDMTSNMLPLHPLAKQLTPFDHLGLNWNPNGHMPAGVFDAAHFDIHFFMISEAQQLAIPQWSSVTDAQFCNFPPLGYMPDSYFAPPADATSEAQMGKHWLPANLTDFLPFSKILILGTFDGAFTFIEPMITQDYLKTGPDFSASYPQPLSFAKPGKYPTAYNIYRNPDTGNIYVSLSGFVTR